MDDQYRRERVTARRHAVRSAMVRRPVVGTRPAVPTEPAAGPAHRRAGHPAAGRTRTET